MPTVIGTNIPVFIDFSMLTDESKLSTVWDLKDNLFMFQDIEDDPSKGLNGMLTSAASAPVANGVYAEHNTIDLPYGM